VYAHNHDLAWWAGAYLSDCWGTSFSTPREMIGAMATVRLPKGLSEESDLKRVQMALFGRSIEVPVFARAGSLWTRVSAQVYNDRADIETLADAVTALAP
jgi:isopenicillin-N epimerase